MKEIHEIKIDSDIIPDKGIGQLILGTNCFYLRGLYAANFRDNQNAFSSEADKGFWKSKLSSPFFQYLYLEYKDFLEININLFSGQISHLTVKNNYQGKVSGVTGLRDTVKSYYHKNQKDFSEFTEGRFFFWVKGRYGLSFFIGDEYEDVFSKEQFDEYLEKPIIAIEIFDDNERLAIGEDLPTKWKNKN